jgi:hypothetical protein
VSEDQIRRDFVIFGRVQDYASGLGVAGLIDQISLNEGGQAFGAIRRQPGTAFRQDSPQNFLLVRHAFAMAGAGSKLATCSCPVDACARLSVCVSRQPSRFRAGLGRLSSRVAR